MQAQTAQSDMIQDPHGCTSSIDQLVAALHEAFMEGSPQHSSKKKRKARPFGRIGTDDDVDTDSEDEEDVKPQVKIPPPIFKGLPGERPDAHLLATEDWMEAMLFERVEYNDKFKHTLQHLAREWYHGLDMHQFGNSWHEFTQHFSRYFSTQGRNIKHLHERWRAFSFDPNTDDIEEYIRDVCEAAKQLGHGDDAVLNLLKATMPTELYGTLYGHDNLYVVMTMLKDIYAKKPQNVVATATRVAQGASALSPSSAPPPEKEPKPLLKGLWRKSCLTSWRLCITWTWMVNLPENLSSPL